MTIAFGPRRAEWVEMGKPGTAVLSPEELTHFEAYDLAYLAQTSGGGATIAIVDAFDDPNAEADLAAYRTEFSLPPCTGANGCFTKVGQSGGASYPHTVDSGWELETSLDLDAVSALCPNCRIVLVEANSDALSDLAAAQAQAAQQGPTAISDSWAVTMSECSESTGSMIGATKRVPSCGWSN